MDPTEGLRKSQVLLNQRTLVEANETEQRLAKLEQLLGNNVVPLKRVS